MSQETSDKRRFRVWQRVFIAAVVLIFLTLAGTQYNTPSRPDDPETAGEDTAPEAAPEGEGWAEEIYAYVVAGDGELSAPFYNEALAEESRCGRGTYIQLESWDPFVSENGDEYYHVFLDGQYGYIRCENISDDRTDILQETQVYVRTTVNLLAEPDSLEIGNLAQKGELLRIVGYDYLLPSGKVHMYEVKLGTEIGWISSEYVVSSYADALENWNNEDNVYANHVLRGDTYGGGDAAELDYWPHEKGDFSDQGNVMPLSCYALYVPVMRSTPEDIVSFLELAEGTTINTFVFTLFDDGELAYDSPVIDSYGILDEYAVKNTTEEFMKTVRMVQDAGYYTVARITAFNDFPLASAFPEWSITDLAGRPIQVNGSYWPSVFCRDVWKLKVGMALEAVDTFGFNEIQFDYVRFPDYIINYEEDGSADLKNTYGESKAQAVQRFLFYATDLIHAHGAYVSADVFGETSNNYVAPYGQYWDAISTVVDVISGMPYPDHYSSYYRNGSYYRPYKHPYGTLSDWAVHVALRQSECSSPAIVRTWIQTWDDADYRYDETAIRRQIVALYDNDITGGFMPWHSYGSVYVAGNLGDAINCDYYILYLKAKQEGMTLSEWLGLDTSE